MTKTTVKLLGVIMLSWLLVSPTLAFENRLLNQIANSTQTNVFADCFYFQCSITPGPLPTIHEEPMQPNHSASFTVTLNGQRGGIYTLSQIMAASSDAQCIISPTSSNPVVGVTGTQTFTVTAVNDIAVEGNHTCVVTLGGPGTNFQLTTLNIPVQENPPPPPTYAVSASHTAFTLSENPASPAGTDASIVTTTYSVPGTIKIRVTTNTECFLTNLQEPVQSINATGRTTLYETTYNVPSGTLNNPVTAQFRGRPDDVVDTSTCSVQYDYFMNGNTVADLTQTVTAAVTDYRPTIDAFNPGILYETPISPQSNTGLLRVRLNAQPSDNSPVNLAITNLNPTLCSISATSGSFNQSTWNQYADFTVAAIQNNVYDPGTRSCNFTLTLTSLQAPTTFAYSGRPLYTLASAKPVRTKAIRAALEYNNLSQNVVVAVLDNPAPVTPTPTPTPIPPTPTPTPAPPPTLPRTGYASTWDSFFVVITAFFVSMLGALATWRWSNVQVLAPVFVEKVHNFLDEKRGDRKSTFY